MHRTDHKAQLRSPRSGVAVLSAVLAVAFISAVVLLIQSGSRVNATSLAELILTSRQAQDDRSTFEILRIAAVGSLSGTPPEAPGSATTATLRVRLPGHVQTARLRNVDMLPDLYSSDPRAFDQLGITRSAIADGRRRWRSQGVAELRFATVHQTLAKFDLPEELAQFVTQRSVTSPAAPPSTPRLLRVDLKMLTE